MTTKRTKGTTKTEAKKARERGVAKAKALAPDLTAQLGSVPKTRFRGRPDLFGRLVLDHDHHRALLAMIEATGPKDAARKRLFRELVREIKAHAAAEEQALWSSVLRNPETTEDGRHAVYEHKKLDDLAADLASRDAATRAWTARFAKLKEVYLHHIREEEQEQFVAAEKHLSAADIRYMRGVFLRRKKDEKAHATIEKKRKLG